MQILEIIHLPDGYDVTVDGDAGRLVLHFLTDPTRAEIERLYALYTIPPENDYLIEAENGAII